MENTVTLQVGVKALLKNKEGKFLLLQRNMDKYQDIKKTDSWDIIGGRIDPGRSLLDNLKREIKEETGLDFTDVPRLVTAQDILRLPGKHIVRLTYVSTIEGTPTLSEEHSDYKWFTENELRSKPGIDTYLTEALEQLLETAKVL